MTLQVWLWHLSVTVWLAVMLAMPQPAKGAVRVCEGPVSSTVVIAKSERVGKRRALDEWKTKAAVFGVGYASWRLAAGKRLACTALAGRGYACLAHGSPCIIKQVPPLTGPGPKPIPG